MRRNWALARTRPIPSSAMIWVSGRSDPDFCRRSSQTSWKQNVWKLLEISFPCMTRIHCCFWKTSSREMRPGATSSIRNQNGNRWRGVHRRPRDQIRVVCRNPRSKHCWSTSWTTKASCIRNFFLQVKPLNAAFYQAALYRLLQCIRRVQPELHRTRKWILSHDKALAHSAIRVRQLLAQKMVAVFDYPPYTPDLAPGDLDAIKDRVAAVIGSITHEGFADCFWKLYERCQTTVLTNGDYFEG